jgi:hypothetical protein
MSKRRRGFPSETDVRRGPRVVHGDKELTEKLADTTSGRLAPDTAFRSCCRNGGRLDGIGRHEYF